MNYPMILVRIPDQSAPTVGIVRDVEELHDWVDAESWPDDIYPTEENLLKAIGDDAHSVVTISVVTIEDAERAREILARGFDPSRGDGGHGWIAARQKIARCAADLEWMTADEALSCAGI